MVYGMPRHKSVFATGAGEAQCNTQHMHCVLCVKFCRLNSALVCIYRLTNCFAIGSPLSTFHLLRRDNKACFCCMQCHDMTSYFSQHYCIAPCTLLSSALLLCPVAPIVQYCARNSWISLWWHDVPWISHPHESQEEGQGCMWWVSGGGGMN